MMDNKYSKKSVPLILCDTTLRDGLRTPYFSPSIEDKLTLFSHLKNSGIALVEVGYVINKVTDFELLDALKAANTLEAGITLLVHANEDDIKIAAAALKGLNHPRLNLYLSVGEIDLPYQDITANETLAQHAMEMVALASTLCDDVQLTLMDATRCHITDLISIAASAMKYGLGTLTIADTVGCATPMSMSQLINTLTSQLNFEFVHLGVHCHNDNHLANEIALMAHQCGVSTLEATIAGIGEREGNVNLLKIMRKHHINTQELTPFEVQYQALIEEHHADT